MEVCNFWSAYFTIDDSVSSWQWDLESLAMGYQVDGWNLAASQTAPRQEAAALEALSRHLYAAETTLIKIYVFWMN